MKSSHPEEQIIRQYLLGKFNNQPELEESLSEKMLLDDELSEIVDSVEDDILDEYLHGTLPPADKQAVDEYFLRPPDRQKKLRFASVWRKYFETDRAKPDEIAPALQSFLTRRGTGAALFVQPRSHFRTYVEIATLILLGTSCLFYLNHVHQELQANITGTHQNLAQLESQLAFERQHSASLTSQLEEFLMPVVPLTLAEDRSRSLPSQRLEIKPTTKVIKVDVVLGQNALSSSYDVALETQTGREILWGKTEVLPSDARLVFDMPSQGIKSGAYSIAVRSHKQQGDKGKHYDFLVTIKK